MVQYLNRKKCYWKKSDQDNIGGKLKCEEKWLLLEVRIITEQIEEQDVKMWWQSEGRSFFVEKSTIPWNKYFGNIVEHHETKEGRNLNELWFIFLFGIKAENYFNSIFSNKVFCNCSPSFWSTKIIFVALTICCSKFIQVECQQPDHTRSSFFSLKGMMIYFNSSRFLCKLLMF